MNKTLKLSMIAAACAAFTFAPVSKAYAEELLIDNGNILISDYNNYNMGRDEVIFSEDFLIDTSADDDILLNDGNNDISNAQQDILIVNASYYGSNGILPDDPGFSGDILRTDPLDSLPVLISDPTVHYSLTDTGASAAGDKIKVQTSSDNTSAAYSKAVTANKNETAIGTQSADTSASAKVNRVTATVKTDSTAGKADKNVSASAGQSGSQAAVPAGTSSQKSNNTGVTDKINRLLKAVNEKRRKAGAGELTLKDDLNYVASLRAKEVSSNYSHTRAGGKNWVTILSQNRVNYSYAGENLACYMESPEQVVSAWAMSPSHNRCMTNGDYTHAGVGTVTVNGCTYWVLTLTD